MRVLVRIAVIVLLVSLCSGCGLKSVLLDDGFSGKWIGLVKLPVVGDTLMRLNITEEEGGYRVAMTADYYRAMGREEVRLKELKITPRQQAYTWQTGSSASFTGKRLDDFLRLDNTLGMSLAVGKVTGTLVLPDGKVIYKDTGEQYPKLKAELVERIRAKEPQAVFVD